MKKLILLLVPTLLLMIVLLSACGNEKTQLTLDKTTLKVGMELKYPPFETKDKAGNPDGVSVKLAKLLGEYLGKSIEIVDTPYPSLIPSLETGKIDFIISSMTITEAREETVDFSIPYTTSQLMLLVHKDSKVKSHNDLDSSDVTISSKTGTIGALWAAKNAPNAKIKNIDEEASAVLEVAQGKADVFIYDPLSIIKHQQNYPDTTIAILTPLPNTKGWGIAVRKGETALVSKINEFITSAKTDGTYDEIRKNYLKEKIEEFKKYGLEFFF